MIRQNERTIDPGASGIRWFSLYEDLEEFGNADAYYTKWETTVDPKGKWVRNEDQRLLRKIHSTAPGVTGSAEDILPCWYNTNRRIWEVISLTSKPKVAWLSTLRTSYTYTGGGAEKELQFTTPLNASDGEFDTLETVASSGYYTKIKLTKPGIYETHAHCAFDSTGWTYTTAADSLGDAFDEVSMRIEAADKNGNPISSTMKTQWTTVLSNFKFSMSTGGIMLLNILPTLFPVTVRVLVASAAQDFTAQSVSGNFYVKSIREELD